MGVELPENFQKAENLHIKGLLEEALCRAIVRDKPLVCRTGRYSSSIIVESLPEDVGFLEPLFKAVGKTSGTINGLFTEVTEDFPERQKVQWAEAVLISIEFRNDKAWVIFDPYIWVWPRRSRSLAREFIDSRCKDRFNQKYNGILSAWTKLILETEEKNSKIELSAFDEGSEVENPQFCIGRTTAFARRIS